ncbi:hypothetical protein [Actinoplanes palleronii]|uniref:hypothetical protein n=1 Tax=Actinoplanes palleronii TaxID=113570 RepID=UPI00194430FF|nr:hypothetical protein [Actinoplanes palleronii]
MISTVDPAASGPASSCRLRRGARGAAVLLLTLTAAAGCSSGGSDTARADQLSFVFHRIGPSGYMDQMLEITNAGRSALVPTLKITAVDEAGVALPGVTVTAAYGADRAGLVLAARETSYDVLSFAGADTAKVADVRVTVGGLTTVDFPEAPDPVEPQPVDDQGQPREKYEPFDAVVLTNPNSGTVSAGVVCIAWDQPPDGQPQQARKVTPLGTTTIEGGASATLPAQGDARKGCDSLKAYFAPPS